MKYPVLSGLRSRLLCVILAIIMPALLLVYLDARREFARAESRVLQDTQRLAELLAGDVQQLLETARGLFASVSWVYRAWPGDPDDEDLLELLAQFVEENRFLAGLQIADPNGMITVSVGTGPAVTTADLDLVQEAIERSQLGVGRFHVDLVGARGILQLAYYIRALPEADDFLVLGFLDFRWFERLLADQRVSGHMSLFPAGMVLSVLAHDGTVLSRYPESEQWTGRVMRDAPILQAILAKSAGAAEAPGVDGVSRLYSFCPVKGSSRELFVSVGIARDIALADASRSLRESLALLAGVGVALLLAAWFGASAVVLRPVHSLSCAAKAIGEGHLDARVPAERGPRELADLATSFNRMTVALQTYDKERSEHLSRLVDYEKQLRSLALEASLAEERERHRIAQGLHDHLGPLLASCYMRLGRVVKKCSGGDHDSDLCQIRELMDNAIQDVQALTFELSSPILYSLGLAEALSRLCEDFDKERHGARFAFQSEGSMGELDHELSALLFRTARELLVNAAKHANARLVSVALQVQNDKVLLTVRDDGVGFEARDAGTQFSRAGGFGLFTIRERVAALDGQMTIESAPGDGTYVTVEVPGKIRRHMNDGDSHPVG